MFIQSFSQPASSLGDTQPTPAIFTHKVATIILSLSHLTFAHMWMLLMWNKKERKPRPSLTEWPGLYFHKLGWLSTGISQIHGGEVYWWLFDMMAKHHLPVQRQKAVCFWILAVSFWKRAGKEGSLSCFWAVWQHRVAHCVWNRKLD